MSKSSLLTLGFMTFALFLGAGNVIFPPQLGQGSGEFFWPATIGFLITAVGLPALTLIAIGYMGDIVAEQRDMIVATKALKSDDASHLLPMLSNLRRCVGDVASLLDLVASRLDAGTPLAFAVADLEDTVASLQSGDKLDALDAQDVAAESLEEVNKLKDISSINVKEDNIVLSIPRRAIFRN